MKKILPFLFYIFITHFYSNCYSQTYCESFDGFTVPVSDQQHAFNIYGNGNPGFLQDWRVTSGTPAILANNDIAGVAPYNGTQYALMAVCGTGGDWSEGLSLKYNFVQGQTYHVTVAIRNAPLPPNNPTPIDVDFILLKDSIPFTYQFSTGCTPTPGIPGNAVIVDSIISFSQNSWQLISFTIPNLTTNYSHLWIRSLFSSGSPLTTTFLCLDSICIQQVVQPVVDCYSFDDTTIVSGSEKQHAFYYYGNGVQGFLKDWYVTSGTPAIQGAGDLAGVFPYNGAQYALLAVCNTVNNWSEGLALKHSFAAGENYEISLAIRNTPLPSNSSTPIDVDFILLQDSIPFTYQFATGCTQTPDTPVASIKVYSLNNYSADIWSVINFPIHNLSSNYSYLWIRSQFSSGSPLVTTFLCIDSMCVHSEVTSVNEIALNRNFLLSVYPNPATNQLNINLGGLQAEQVSIYNVDGKLVSQPKQPANNRIDISGLAKGVYIAEVKVRDEVQRVRWVKM